MEEALLLSGFIQSAIEMPEPNAFAAPPHMFAASLTRSDNAVCLRLLRAHP